jgi:3-hydroxyisobutyrate dehydrogenase-like beta-hydroxyacid dehydrogenase
MSELTVGVVHPGEMGSAVAAALRGGGHRVVWASAGRGAATRKRAEAAGLDDVGDLRALAAQAAVIISVCPPHGARDIAEQVAALGYRGAFVDANALAPATARAIGDRLEAAGAEFVDGGIIGLPPRRGGSTRLYLAGSAAPRVARLFAGSVLEAIAIEGPPGGASALKMAYAAWTKGTSALLMAVRALAVHHRVDDALLAEWARSQPDLPRRSEDAARGNAGKAWRFVGEMDEIAATFAAAGLPPGFHEAAAEVYRRLAGWKDTPAPPSIAEVAKTLAP